MRTVCAHAALTAQGIIRNPVIRLEGRRITDISSYDPSQLDFMPGTEFHSGVIIPQMVNAHLHLELSYLRGAIPRGCGFAGFAAAMARTRGLFTLAQRLEAAEEADAAMRREGIAFAGDISNDDTSFAVKSVSGLHYHTFAEVFGLLSPSFKAAGRLLDYGATLSPHSTYSLQDEPFRRVCSSDGDAPLSIHFMETPAERELYHGRGALHDWYASQGWQCDFLHYGSPAERIAACVPPERSVMLVHCCCVGQRDIDIIMNHFTAPVYWVLCPRSNDYISGLKPDIGLLRRNGLNICIGTDSLASNDSLSLIEELKQLCCTPQGGDIPLSEALQWVTANGAAALGIGRGAATIDVGNECDLAVVEGCDTDSGGGRLTSAARAHAI